MSCNSLRHIQALRIKRFWKTLKDEFLEGETFDSFEKLNTELQGYSIYYNEYKPLSSLNGKSPSQVIRDLCT